MLSSLHLFKQFFLGQLRAELVAAASKAAHSKDYHLGAASPTASLAIIIWCGSSKNNNFSDDGQLLLLLLHRDVTKMTDSSLAALTTRWISLPLS